ncbi:MAG: lipoprotein-releasing ABC transporter permease subunit [Candidatus Omnitrophica bacterium]|nr:lipoprotein-releasing ABC transporter permease subunit [Candidatus Omnitrophota bacterium]
MRYEYFIALRHLARRRRTGFISLISLISIAGVAVGVMALIVVLAVMSGFDTELKSKIVGVHPHVIIEQSTGMTDPAKVIKDIEALGNRHIRAIAPFVTGQALVRSEAAVVGVVVKGVDPTREDLSGFKRYLRKGAMDFESKPREDDDKEPVGGLVLGNELARFLQVGIGDRVFLISPSLESSGGLIPRKVAMIPFEVRGIYGLGMNEFDTTMVVVGLPEAQSLFRLEGKTSGVSLRLDDVDNADAVKKVVANRLGFSFWVRTWFDLNRNFFSALKVEKTIMTILLFLIILVAAFNIVSMLIMVVMEKVKDIGILRALGATRRSIRKIFLFEGFVVGGLGIIIGSVLGLVIAANLNPIADFIKRTTGVEVFPSDIYYFDKIPAEINLGDVIVIVFFALFLSILAGLYPAHKASRLEPVEALRYE